jgi:cytochrome c oxidase subunit 2
MIRAALLALAFAGGCRRPAVLDPAGPGAERIAELWWAFAWVLAAVYAAVLIALGVALVRGRRGDGAPAPTERRATRVIAAAGAATTVVLLVLLVASVRTGSALSRIEGETPLVVEVKGRQWWWSIRYPAPASFETANELHLPVGRTVQLQLASDDVIHSFWVPSLHGKRDLIPGRSTELFLRVDRPGTYLGACAEFCGAQHAKMEIVVVAEPQAAFDAWRQRQRHASRVPETDAERRGRDVFFAAACPLCHTLRGTPAGGRVGPDLTHLASRVRIAGNALPNTPAHRIGWITDPQASKPGARMPATHLLGDELEALALYLGSLE